MQSINRLIEKSKNTRKGFTVLELLVASLLLGMLMTILTMIFNQSSIAWSTGVSGVATMSGARVKISGIRHQADNAYEWNGPHYVQSIFDNKGDVRTAREGADGYLNSAVDSSGSAQISLPSGNASASQSYSTVDVSSPGKGKDRIPYIVNVVSWGPDRKEDTRYDNIYSVSPTDDPTQW